MSSNNSSQRSGNCVHSGGRPSGSGSSSGTTGGSGTSVGSGTSCGSGSGGSRPFAATRLPMPRREESHRSSQLQQKSYEVCCQLFEEQKKTREECKKMSISISKIEAELKQLNDEIRQQSETLFCVESSIYKVSIFH